MPVRLVVDQHAEAPTGPGGAPAPAADTSDHDADGDIDVSQLADADDVADTGLERVTSVFPGAELVDDGSDPLH